MTRATIQHTAWTAIASFVAAVLLAAPWGAQAQVTAQYRPDKVRELMLSIHGYSREGLQSASTNVDEILMMLADDPQELSLVRRQAIKGLRLYTNDRVLGFIEQRSAAAPPDLKRLYLGSAASFAVDFPDRVRALVETNLEDETLGVRYSALKLAGALGQSSEVRAVLQGRLEREPDAKLKSAIQKRLQ